MLPDAPAKDADLSRTIPVVGCSCLTSDRHTNLFRGLHDDHRRSPSLANQEDFQQWLSMEGNVQDRYPPYLYIHSRQEELSDTKDTSSNEVIAYSAHARHAPRNHNRKCYHLKSGDHKQHNFDADET